MRELECRALPDTAAGTRIYAAIDGGKTGKPGGLYRSDDGGARWQCVNGEDDFISWYASRLTVAPGDRMWSTPSAT